VLPVPLSTVLTPFSCPQYAAILLALHLDAS
jgi:hypothetical protein